MCRANNQRPGDSRAHHAPGNFLLHIGFHPGRQIQEGHQGDLRSHADQQQDEQVKNQVKVDIAKVH
jgi:hypothetical protein